MNQIREIQRINEEELSRGIAGTSASWHAKYANSAWCFVGNLDHQLTEGDVIAVLSEYGEIDDMHLVRDEDTGKSKGFCFCKYEDARSCTLAVDNLCGFPLLGRSMRVDHVENYRLPKSLQEKEEELQKRLADQQGLAGHAYEGVELANQFSLSQGQDLFAKPRPIKRGKDEDDILEESIERNMKNKKRREEKRREKDKRRQEKEKRKRERAEIRMEREERRRKKRARELLKDGEEENNNNKQLKPNKEHRYHEDQPSRDIFGHSEERKKANKSNKHSDERKHSTKHKTSRKSEHNSSKSDKKSSKRDYRSLPNSSPRDKESI